MELLIDKLKESAKDTYVGHKKRVLDRFLSGNDEMRVRTINSEQRFEVSGFYFLVDDFETIEAIPSYGKNKI